MNIYSVIPFTSFLINIVLATVVLTLNPHSKTNRAFSLFSCNFAFWAFIDYLKWNFSAPSLLMVYERIEPVCWLPITFLVLNFIHELTKRKRGNAFWLLAAIVIIWTVVAVTTGDLISGYRPAYWGEFVLVENLYFPAVLMSSFLPAVWGFHILNSTIKATHDLHFRTQLHYLLIGTLIMFIVVFSDSVIRVSLLRIDSLPVFGSSCLSIQSAFVFFAIVRHRFLNVDVRDAALDIFSHVLESVILLNMNQEIIDLNASAREFFGIGNDETVTDPERLFGEHYSFHENNKNLEIAYAYNNKKKIGLLSQSDLFDHGRLIGKLVLIHDITHRREEERKRAQLEYQVQRSHTSRLESLGMLAGGIAHDFNNVLAGVTGFATLLRMGMIGKDDKMQSYAENILKTSRLAADLTKKLLTFTRRNTPEMMLFNLHGAVMDTVSMLRHTIDKKIRIVTDLSAHNFFLKGDRVQIQNMLLNMAINAGDAMPEGGELSIKTRNKELSTAQVKAINKEAEGGCFVVVEVGDNGTGMSDIVKKRIFDPFFTTKNHGKGTGLGLASAFGIVGNHKGFISVDTEIGKGTVFHVFFPATFETMPPEPDDNTRIERGKGRILLVDDDELVNTSTAAMLEAIGYTVISYRNGKDAVNWFRANDGRADLALLDVMMPIMTGDRCAGELLKINPDMKILFMSGSLRTLPEVIFDVSLTDGGPIKIIWKPFALEQLSHMVKTAMN